MLVRRQQMEARAPLRYGWADSSQVGKTDWFISKHVVVLTEDSMAAAAAARELTRTRPDLVDHDDKQRRQELSQLLFHALRVHTHVPHNLGLGSTGIEHKVASLLFACYLECGSFPGLVELMSSFVSFCSDMGTELWGRRLFCQGLVAVAPGLAASSASRARPG